MTTLKGRHWHYAGGILTMFGLTGIKIGHQAYFGDGPRKSLVAAYFESPRNAIHQGLSDRRSAHGDDKVASLGVNEYMAFQLFFENILTLKHIHEAEEGENSITAKVMFSFILREVIIRPSQQLEFYDASGEILKFSRYGSSAI
jgi:hypothetical protein